MCLTNVGNIRNSLRFKLTLWFSLIFTLAFFLVFTITFSYIRNHLKEITDSSLFEKVKRQLWLGYPLHNTSVDVKDVREAFEFIASKEGSNTVFYVFLDSAYTIITNSSLEHWQGLQLDSASLPYLPDKPDKEQIKSFLNSKSNREKATTLLPLNHDYRSHTILQTIKVNGRDDKIRIAYQYFNNRKMFITGISIQDNQDFEKILSQVFLISYVILLVVVILLVNILTKKTLEGVEKVRNTAIRIGKDKFNLRVPFQHETTEIKSLASAFNDMLDRIEHLMKEQKEITHNIAHDLRSPITSIRGITETTLSADSSVHEYEHMAGKIIANCDRLVHLINSMLDISDIESGNFQMQMQGIAIKNILDECYEVYQPIAEDKHIRFIKTEIDDTIIVNGNKHLLQRAFGNVVGNALKFTGHGGTVSIDVEKNQHEAKISISDNGIGIPQHEQKRIFERFYRVDKSRSVEGSGLGLSLSKAYIEYQKGRIDLFSETGKGSTFIISLPLY